MVGGEELDIVLNEGQQKVFDELKPRVEGGRFSVNLLHGVTGSGKTEIYLQCIRKVVEAGRQVDDCVSAGDALKLRKRCWRFTARFPRVAILQ